MARWLLLPHAAVSWVTGKVQEIVCPPTRAASALYLCDVVPRRVFSRNLMNPDAYAEDL
jgi:hypothetical protein